MPITRCVPVTVLQKENISEIYKVIRGLELQFPSHALNSVSKIWKMESLSHIIKQESKILIKMEIFHREKRLFEKPVPYVVLLSMYCNSLSSYFSIVID